MVRVKLKLNALKKSVTFSPQSNYWTAAAVKIKVKRTYEKAEEEEKMNVFDVGV